MIQVWQDFPAMQWMCQGLAWHNFWRWKWDFSVTIINFHNTDPYHIICVTTYPTTGVRAKSQRSVFQKEKRVGVATDVYSRKTLEKPKRVMRILKLRVRELFMHKEGISTLCARHKGRKSLIKCAKTWLQYYLLFLFYILIFFGVNKGVALAPTYPQVRWGIQTYVVL